MIASINESEIQSNFNLHALHNRCLIENSLFHQFGLEMCARHTNFANAVHSRAHSAKKYKSPTKRFMNF